MDLNFKAAPVIEPRTNLGTVLDIYLIKDASQLRYRRQGSGNMVEAQAELERRIKESRRDYRLHFYPYYDEEN